MSSKNDVTIIADPALDVHHDWCEPTSCRADRAGADNEGRLEAVVHCGPRYGFAAHPPVSSAHPDEITVQLEEFDNRTDPKSMIVLLTRGGETIELSLEDMQSLQVLLEMARVDLATAVEGSLK